METVTERLVLIGVAVFVSVVGAVLMIEVVQRIQQPVHLLQRYLQAIHFGQHSAISTTPTDSPARFD